ncbi:MAG: 30S ribosomal protein S11 [Patescibacteria group bacterium]
MGKKRIVTSLESGAGSDQQAVSSGSSKKSSRKQVLKGAVHILSSYNNTIVTVTDSNGNVVAFSSAGTLGFKGARKSTPYAATLVGKDAVEKAKRFGFQEARISIKGIGPGREAAIRGVASTGLNITAIVDATPMPHNGVRPTKPRRV